MLHSAVTAANPEFQTIGARTCILNSMTTNNIPRCNKLMPVARTRCGKRPGHNNKCLSQRTLDRMREKQQASYVTRNTIHLQAWIGGDIRARFIDYAKRNDLTMRAAMEQAIETLLKNEDTL